MTPLRVRLTYGPAIRLFSVHYGSDTCIVLISAPATPAPPTTRALTVDYFCSPLDAIVPASPLRGTPSASARFLDA